ncbi:MAG: hypothetical protein ABIL58_20815 [Pseudomonadota bacterium]
MRPISRRTVICVLCAAVLLLTLAQPALARNPSVKQIEPTAESMTADVLLLRPASFVGMVLGACVYVISAPFSAAGGNIDAAGQALVVEPAKYTFVRPLGSF